MRQRWRKGSWRHSRIDVNDGKATGLSLISCIFPTYPVVVMVYDVSIEMHLFVVAVFLLFSLSISSETFNSRLTDIRRTGEALLTLK